MDSILPVQQARPSVWPVIAAPIVAALYYIALKSAFSQSIVSALGEIATSDIDISEVTSPQWGTHWLYRVVAEAGAICFATFVAAGLSRGRERLASIVAGCAISLGFGVRLALLFYVWKFADSAYEIPEPWYQYVIDAVALIAAPFIGVGISDFASTMHDDEPAGFGGINRLHFLWLWIPSYWYGVGLVGPVWRIFMREFDGSYLISSLIFILNIIPMAAILIPGYLGISYLSGQSGQKMHSVVRNLVGVLVLIVGFVLGTGLQSGWYWMFQKLRDVISS